MTGRPIIVPGPADRQRAARAGIVGLAWSTVAGAETRACSSLMLCAALLLGVLLVIPVGGADMPVVISMLNAFTGSRPPATGFVLDNTALIIAGSLVGASGTLLTILMGRAMNRSLANVLFGAFGGARSRAGGGRPADGDRAVREATVDDVATMLAYADRVIVVPATGWPWHRHSTACASWPTSSRSAASR